MHHDHPDYGPGPTPSATDFRGQGIPSRGQHPPVQTPLQDAVIDPARFDAGRHDDRTRDANGRFADGTLHQLPEVE